MISFIEYGTEELISARSLSLYEELRDVASGSRYCLRRSATLLIASGWRWRARCFDTAVRPPVTGGDNLKILPVFAGTN